MRRIALFLSIGLVSACSAAVGPQPVNNQPSSQQVPATAGGGGAGSAPHASPGTEAASKGAPTAPNDDKVAELQAAYDKNPSDAALKKKLADATFENAQFYMYNSPLPPNQKYPKALTLYRQTVKLDPSNSAAQDSIQMIESIYRSMGKDVPAA